MEVRASNILDELIEKEALSMSNAKTALKLGLKATSGKPVIDPRLINAGIGASIGGVAGATTSEKEDRLKNALIGAGVGALGGTLTGTLTNQMVDKAMSSGFAKGVGTGVTGTVIGQQAAKGVKKMSENEAVKNVANSAAEKVKDLSSSVKGNASKAKDKIGEGGARLWNLIKTSSEYSDEFANDLLDKVASTDLTLGELINLKIDEEISKIAMQDMSAVSFVEKVAQTILGDFLE